MDINKIEKILLDNGEQKFRIKQISKAVYQDGISSFSEITTLSKDLRQSLDREMKILSFDIVNILTAKDNQSAKALLRTNDGNLIETVLISPKPDTRSVCISCQVGCQMGCRFCATGSMGFKRNLTVEEITDQVLFWRQFLKKNENCDVNNIVYMGMGEPFNNWEKVSESIRILTDKNLFGFGSRSIAVSTSGIAEGIMKLAEEFPQVNLALSLHFADDAKRNEFMPVNKKDNLENLRNALKKYFAITTRKVFLEYIMLDGINDTALDAKMLSDFVYSIGNTHLLHVNLIRYNTTGEDLKPSSKTRAQIFKQELEKHRVNATVRKSLGEEIQGACGQLAGQ